MMKKRAFLLSALLLIAVNVFILSLASVWPKSWPEFPLLNVLWHQQAVPSAQDSIRVKRVIDGDTVELASGERVRYIGVNAPESVDPRKKAECFGKEAAKFNQELVEGNVIRLERDISNRDKYGRLLRFVYLEDGTLVNEILVREGYASVATYPPDVAKKDMLRGAEQEARDEKRGLWNEMTCNGKK